MPRISHARSARTVAVAKSSASAMAASVKGCPNRQHGQRVYQDICINAESGDLLSPCLHEKVLLSMHFTSPILGALALFVTSNPAMALDAWVTSVERGLPVFSVETSKGALRLICDPDRVFGPTSNGGVTARFAKDDNPAMLVFLAKSGEQARLTLKNGMATQAAADPDEWTKMLTILRVGGEFAVVTSLDSLTLETPAMPDLACD